MGAGAGFVQDQPEASLNATLLFRVGGVDTDLFIADARRSPQKFVLLADPYLREVKRLDAASVMRDVKDIYDCPYIYLANVVRDYIPTSDWAEWGITGERQGRMGRLKPFGSRFSIMPLPHRRDIVTLNVTSITFDATERRGTEQRRDGRAAAIAPRAANSAPLHPRFPRLLPALRGVRRYRCAPRAGSSASISSPATISNTRARFPDAIARGSYPMSVQSLTQPNVRQHLFVRDGGDYDIPYRLLVPEESRRSARRRPLPVGNPRGGRLRPHGRAMHGKRACGGRRCCDGGPRRRAAAGSRRVENRAGELIRWAKLAHTLSRAEIFLGLLGSVPAPRTSPRSRCH